MPSLVKVHTVPPSLSTDWYERVLYTAQKRACATVIGDCASPCSPGACVHTDAVATAGASSPPLLPPPLPRASPPRPLLALGALAVEDDEEAEEEKEEEEEEDGGGGGGAVRGVPRRVSTPT